MNTNIARICASIYAYTNYGMDVADTIAPAKVLLDKLSTGKVKMDFSSICNMICASGIEGESTAEIFLGEAEGRVDEFENMTVPEACDQYPSIKTAIGDWWDSWLEAQARHENLAGT